MLYTNQAWPHRQAIMTEVFLTYFRDRPIVGLEAGVWFGEGSTVIWGMNCAPGSTLLLVDSWTPYSSLKELSKSTDTALMDAHVTEAFISSFINIRKIERMRASQNIRLNMIRAKAAEFMAMLPPDSLDFIFIDGDHKYEAVKGDLIEARRLINKRYGVICGDDLELFPTDDLYQLAINHKDEDFIHTDGGEGFHPGVLAAVFETFDLDMIYMKNGFWWATFGISKG